ncbi:MAG: radical SAM family heme chaperone HemW [Nitrospiraceae bacterium]|nr:MAG: radical SAM family heme chaperone HemW [Nitrospiraceae bacterium]
MHSLYIHIPFCFRRCIYCDFVSRLYSGKQAEHYVQILKKELRDISSGTFFSTLFIGGGTPTALSGGVITNLIMHVFDSFQFSTDYEATIEANPGTVDRAKLTAIRSGGINRISLGVQSFNDEELTFLGRIHTAKEAEEAVELAKAAGFRNVSIDLIYGIPGQSLSSWKSSLARAVELEPHHISTYELTVEKGTALDTMLQSAGCPISSPDEDRTIEMYEYTIDYLTSRGYVHYEISNFARPGYLCKHNMNYWERGEYYGIGLGAHSFIGKTRFSNTDNFETYLHNLSTSRSPVREKEKITDKKTLAEVFFLGLRKTGGIDLKAISKLYGLDIEKHFHKKIKELREAKLIYIDPSGSVLRLTRKGLALSNEVFIKFI